MNNYKNEIYLKLVKVDFIFNCVIGVSIYTNQGEVDVF